MPEARSRTIRSRIAEAAATTGATMAMLLPGTSMFRMFQKLHYTSYASPVLSAGERPSSDRMALEEMSQLLELLGSGVTKSALAEVHAKDEITARVLVELQAIADDARDVERNLDPVEALVMVANLGVLDLDVDNAGVVLPHSSGSRITLAQLLLKRSLARWRREVDPVFDATPTMQAKWFRLNELTKPGSRDDSTRAERAFVEIFGARQLFSLLGDDSVVLGPHLTVEQWVRQYSSMSETDRARQDAKLRGEAAYLGRKRATNMPYDLNELRDSDGKVQLSAFRAVADAMMGAGHGRITMDKSGKLSGEFADSSDRVSGAFHTAHRLARVAMTTFLRLSPDADIGVGTVQRMVEENPDFAKMLFDLVPDSIANAVIRQVGDKTMASNWVYQILAEPNADRAEMILWRNVLEAELRAYDATNTNDDEVGDRQREREFMRLPRRMHRVVWNLKASKNQLLMDQFEIQLAQATNLEMFFRWVNRQPGLRGQQAPLVPWYDDTSQFDMDKANGGWGATLSGSDLREAISSLERGTRNLAHERARRFARWRLTVRR